MILRHYYNEFFDFTRCHRHWMTLTKDFELTFFMAAKPLPFESLGIGCKPLLKDQEGSIEVIQSDRAYCYTSLKGMLSTLHVSFKYFVKEVNIR